MKLKEEFLIYLNIYAFYWIFYGLYYNNIYLFVASKN